MLRVARALSSHSQDGYPISINEPQLTHSSSRVVISSDLHHAERYVVEATTVSFIKELELRAARHDLVFANDAQNLAPFHTSTMAQYLAMRPAAAQDRFITGLRDAYHIADRIADYGAQVSLDCAGEDLPETIVELRIHHARQDFIRGLSPLRKAFLVVLAHVLAEQYRRRHPAVQRADDWVEITMLFQETFLREGSAFVSAFLFPFEEGEREERESKSGSTDMDVLPPYAARSELARWFADDIERGLVEQEAFEEAYGEMGPQDYMNVDVVPVSLMATAMEEFVPEVDEEDEEEQGDVFGWWEEEAEDGEEDFGEQDVGVEMGVMGMGVVMDAVMELEGEEDREGWGGALFLGRALILEYLFSS